MIELGIPESVAGTFVVATAHPVDDPVAAARARVRLPSAFELLDSPLLEIHTFPAGGSGYADLLSWAAWVEPGEQHLLDAMTHHIVGGSSKDAPSARPAAHTRPARPECRTEEGQQKCRAPHGRPVIPGPAIVCGRAPPTPAHESGAPWTSLTEFLLLNARESVPLVTSRRRSCPSSSSPYRRP